MAKAVLGLIGAIPAAALAALIGLRWWMSQPKRVFAEIDALDLSDEQLDTLFITAGGLQL